MTWLKRYAFLLFIILYLTVHLLIINDYGLTWDFHHHFFAGLHRLGIPITQDLAGNSLPYSEPDPRGTFDLPFGPIMSISPIFTFQLFYRTLDLLPFDSAYNLSIVLWGVAGVAILYGFLSQAINARVALIASIFLALTPRYFGDIHNNMKDVPMAVMEAVNIWALWRLVTYRRMRDLTVAVLAFAIAFNVKVNSIFIPVIFAVWLLLQTIKHGNVHLSKHYFLFSVYFFLAPLAAFLLWSLFFPNPLQTLLYIPAFFRDNTQNIEVPYFGAWYCSAKNVPWHYPFVYLGITTPLPVLLSFMVGVGFSLYTIVRRLFMVHSYQIGVHSSLRSDRSSWFVVKRPFPSALSMNHLAMNYELSTMLLLWFFIPLSRYLLPSMGVIDGIRHFEEVLFPLCAIAALGTFQIFSFARRGLAKLVFYIALLFSVFFLLFTLYSYHPYQITYFNQLVGGARGAIGKFDLDYWGTSQKEAVQWVNAHAPQNSKVHIVMMADVAGRYVRPDLLPNLNRFGYDDSDFVVFLNRQSFLYRFFYAYEYLLHHRPVYTVSAAGAPLTWVFDNRTDNTTERQTPYWTGVDPCIRKYW
jgi:hypothetical protein